MPNHASTSRAGGAAPSSATPGAPLDVAQTFAGKRLLFVGATGFVGKVALSLLLKQYPGVGKVFVLVRPGAGSSADERFFRKIAASPVFEPLRQVWGDGYDAFLREKVQPLPGDVSRPLLNFAPADLETIGKLDAIVNCAGLVSFTPPLETALRINVYGVQNCLALAERTGAALIHISTCFVAGNRDGEIWEDEPVRGYFPRRDDLRDQDFSAEAEIADCQRLIEHTRARADDRASVSRFRDQGAAYLRAEGRDADDERTLKIAVQRERKIWMHEQLTRLGMERAQHWGWPNTYTYTKSLGEQLCAAADDKFARGEAGGVKCCIVRPSIVESAFRYPFPGWNEGFNTTGPLVMLTLLGHRSVPAGENVILDIIPVDLVAAGMIAATAATIAGRNERVYQLCSGDTNPFYQWRAVTLTGLFKRRYYRDKADRGDGSVGERWWNRVRARLEPIPVSKERFQRTSAPLWRAAAESASRLLDEWTPRWGAPRVEALASRAKERLDEVAQRSRQVAEMVDIFMPFIWDRRFTYRADATRRLFAELEPHDRAAIPWIPEQVEWRSYWLDIHVPGLEKWVFPSLEEEFRAKPRSVYSYKDLLEMFDATTKHHRHRTAMKLLPPPSEEGREPARYTYEDLQQLAQRVAGSLREKGVQAGDRVMLLSENRPEWGITYFGVLKAGAAVVPVDHQATLEEVTNLLKWSRAKAAVISPRVATRLAEAGDLATLAPDVSLLDYDAILAVEPRVAAGALVHQPKGDDITSLIFTSGTTGRPKGVMLSHRNFSSLISKMASIFDLSRHDGLLSVLPLHHTFEFTVGLLLPLMRGAQINYLDTVEAEALGRAFDDVNVTGMIGVPQLWQALERRITKSVVERGPIVERIFRFLVEGHRRFRDGAPFALNLGKLLFWPIHRRLGGRLRLLVSGGSALPPETMKTFRGLGFDLYEGYGLTEAAPVLTVNRPHAKAIPGSVGEPLPGVDVKIANPDASGVGEVIASGPNVMIGYFEDAESTAQALDGGWLRTGDLGRFDEEKRLFIVGRKKDVIVGSSGENVYPDELEEVYGDAASAAGAIVKELSIVGLPDGKGGEIVACLAVPQTGVSADLVREHFAEVSGRLPPYKRVKVLHVASVELPRTATRKVKRKVVAQELEKLERLRRKGDEVARSSVASGPEAPLLVASSWLEDVLATVSGKSLDEVRKAQRLDELGFDSLMYTELGVALEAAGVGVPDGADLTDLLTVQDVERRVAMWGRKPPAKEKLSGTRARKESRVQPGEAQEIHVPRPVVSVGNAALDLAQRMTYERLLRTRVTGKSYIPPDRNFIVAANHASHLDMGLVKMALGDWGPKLVALAAKDYFFADPVRRAYFENFTSLVPMDRHGSLRESLRLASEVLEQGYCLLIFPEGTRSETGVMTSFKPSVGYLALANRVGILPMYLEGTHDAMPKGSLWPRQREIAAHIGPFQSHEALERAVASHPRGEHNREAARLVEAEVRALAPRGSVNFRARGSLLVEGGSTAAEERR